MKILVTGANGYLGQGVVKKLLDDGITVVATDFSLENVDDRAIKKKGDLFCFDDPYSYYESPDCVLHMAWRNGFVHNAPSHIEDISLHYTFIKKMISSGVRQVAVMGTMHEVGFFEGSIDECTPVHPANLYGIGKNALRDAVQLICKESNCVFQWLRGFYIVGNSRFGNSVFSKITASEAGGKEWFPFTMGSNQCDFIDYDEFCRQTSAAVEQTSIDGIINICSGYPEKLADRVERFIHENGYKIKLDYGCYPEREYDSKAVWGNANKIRTIMQEYGRKEYEK